MNHYLINLAFGLKSVQVTRQAVNDRFYHLKDIVDSSVLQRAVTFPNRACSWETVSRSIN